MAPFFRAAFGFMARVLGRTVLCSGLLWCAVLRDWARKKIRFQRFRVFPWYHRSFRRRWMAGSELSLITDQFQLEKSPVWCWTGKSDSGWVLGGGFFLCSPGALAGPCPAYLARELAEAVGCFCGAGEKNSGIEQNF